MTKGQKAMVAVAAGSLNHSTGTQTVLAFSLGLDKAMVTWAKTVGESTPAAVPAVIAGTLALKDAYDQAKAADKKGHGLPGRLR